MDVVVEQISSEQLMSEEFFLIVFQEESLFVLLESMNCGNPDHLGSSEEEFNVIGDSWAIQTKV